MKANILRSLRNQVSGRSRLVTQHAHHTRSSRRLLWLDQCAYIGTHAGGFGNGQCIPSHSPRRTRGAQQGGLPCHTGGGRTSMKAMPYDAHWVCSPISPTLLVRILVMPVNLVAQFSQNPGVIHWRAVKAILRYLCGTAKFALFRRKRERKSGRSAPGTDVYHGCKLGQQHG